MKIPKLIVILMAATFSGCHVTPVNDAPSDNGLDTMSDRLIARFFESIPLEPIDEANSSTGSVYMQLLTMVGREDIHARFTNWPGQPQLCAESQRIGEDVFTEIADRASRTRVVIINEAHDQPHHRNFISLVAAELWDLGYRVYAAETFTPHIEHSQAIPYTRIVDGNYSSEPVFGALVREVKLLGYRLAPYEPPFSAGDSSLSQYERAAIREEGQAENLTRLVASLDDNERLLVHVGYSHASEVPIRSFGGKDLAWMAARFKEKTGIDPLTIDQTKCISGDDSIRVFKDAGRTVPGQFDLQISHPAVEIEGGRPNWRESLGAKRVDIPESLLDLHARVIIEARPQSEPLGAVPADRVLLWPDEKLPLILMPGTYDIVSFREGGGVPGKTTIIVAP